MRHVKYFKSIYSAINALIQLPCQIYFDEEYLNGKKIFITGGTEEVKRIQWDGVKNNAYLTNINEETKIIKIDENTNIDELSSESVKGSIDVDEENRYYALKDKLCEKFIGWNLFIGGEYYGVITRPHEEGYYE